ncbi:hypothetical protein [Leptospira ryugenii]|uniref:hypothetical protein n=1 Tax=Leptospira ryugenii TaxID=1917863 RepID=UPI000D594AF6|nr:hypothetical protein [Leptospira ryugenii]
MNVLLIPYMQSKEILSLLWVGRLSAIFVPEMTPNQIFRKGLKAFLSLFCVYVFFYVSIFLLAYSYFTKLNEAMAKEFLSKGFSKFSLFLNQYPWNVLYILSSLLIFFLCISHLTYFLNKILEEKTQSYFAHLGICLYATTYILLSILFVFLINTIFPYRPELSVYLSSCIIASWMLLYIFALYFSTKVYSNIYFSIFNSFKRRSALVWAFSFIYISYQIVSILVGI